MGSEQHIEWKLETEWTLKPNETTRYCPNCGKIEENNFNPFYRAINCLKCGNRTKISEEKLDEEDIMILKGEI